MSTITFTIIWFKDHFETVKFIPLQKNNMFNMLLNRYGKSAFYSLDLLGFKLNFSDRVKQICFTTKLILNKNQ